MESCINYELQLLANKLNSNNIPTRSTNYNELEIFYDENNKDVVLNLLSKIKNNKIVYKFKSIKEKNPLL